MLAHGVPLLLAGDEVGNSQNGNNNAYCQDNEIGWVDWSQRGQEGEDLTDFIARLADLRRRFPQLRPRHWVEGKRADGILRRAVAHAAGDRNDRDRLEISQRPLPRLRARGRTRRRALVYRLECGT